SNITDSIRLTLKDNIKFQNGKKVTGEAVKASLEESIQKSDLVKASLPIKDIKVNGQKLQITTKSAYPEHISELASQFSAIYDTKAIGDINKTTVGTSPYQIKDYKQTTQIQVHQKKDKGK